MAETYLVSRHHPSSLGDELGGLLIDRLLGSSNLVDSEVLEGTGLLDVLEGSGEILELQVDGLLGGLGVLDSLNLKGINGLELAADVVGGRLEVFEALLNLVDNGLVLQHGAVGGEVDRRGMLGQLLHLAASILVALLESLERGDGVAAQAQRGGHLGPVELQSSTSLFRGGEN